MPSRILRDGHLTSGNFDRLRHWQSHILFYRLISLVDDYGRFPAEPAVIKNSAFPTPVLSGKVRRQHVAEWLDDLAAADLIALYTYTDACGSRPLHSAASDIRPGEKRFLVIAKLGATLRAKKSKFPAPPGQQADLPGMSDDDMAPERTKPPDKNLLPVTNTKPPCGPPAQGFGNEKPRKHKTQCPTEWEITPEMYLWAKGNCGLAAGVVERETEKMIDHFTAREEPMADWLAVWRNWMRRVNHFER